MIRKGERIWLFSKFMEGKMSTEVKNFGKELKDLVDRMFETLSFHQAVGLAAPQIGVFSRVCIVHLPRTFDEPQLVMVNPVIIAGEGTAKAQEACLSAPGKGTETIVRRFYKIKVSWQDLTGESHVDEGEGLMAGVIQHEVDHLNGLFYFDHVGRIKRELIIRHHRKSIKKKIGLENFYVTEQEQKIIYEASMGSKGESGISHRRHSDGAEVGG